ncbi:MAG TPA: FemAB family XrtA/PEP-CTERM system-associated protein [Gammaproteobacteria bacterium]|nr:FemAB family XrtA/PEP-CTERM system-associated protein [Gammaproteobacteria bacterium]
MSLDNSHLRERPGLAVRPLEAGDEARWDAFVEGCPEATFFHLSGWKTALERGLGHRAPFLLAEREGAVEGILPLGHLRSWLFGNALVSTPFCVYGGVAAVSDEARRALEEEALRMAEDKGVDFLELRHRQPRHPDWPARRDRYATFRKTLDPDPDVNFAGIRRKQRAEIRKGIQAGLQAEVDPDVERFFPVYAESVRNLGTPVFPKRFLRTLKEVFGADCEVLVIRHGGRVLSGVLSFYFRSEVLPYYGGSVREARAVSANDFMYWALMRRAVEAGVAVFDFGRSKTDSGAYHFKRHWGFEPVPLHYEYRLVRSREVPDVSPANPRYQRLISAWRHLPLPVTRAVGPWIARSLG